MTRFLKLTNSRTYKPILVNIAHIREIETNAENGSDISFNNESWYKVTESLDKIIKMIEQEEVVK